VSQLSSPLWGCGHCSLWGWFSLNQTSLRTLGSLLEVSFQAVSCPPGHQLVPSHPFIFNLKAPWRSLEMLQGRKCCWVDEMSHACPWLEVRCWDFEKGQDIQRSALNPSIFSNIWLFSSVTKGSHHPLSHSDQAQGISEEVRGTEQLPSVHWEPQKFSHAFQDFVTSRCASTNAEGLWNPRQLSR